MKKENDRSCTRKGVPKFWETPEKRIWCSYEVYSYKNCVHRFGSGRVACLCTLTYLCRFHRTSGPGALKSAILQNIQIKMGTKLDH